ncbi:MAG: isocitrate/isopropylmalate family dehydrogenase [Smithellaceae bacterium]
MNKDRLAARVISGWADNPRKDPFLIGYFPGEGIGSEIIPPATELLCAVCEKFGRRIALRAGGLIGKPALETTGHSLTEEAIDFCEQIFSDGGTILCGPGGSRFVYELRAHFDLYCKLTPLLPCPPLRDAGCLKPQHVADLDILAVRENTGGLYFGKSDTNRDKDGNMTVSHRFSYSAAQVRRILACAFAAASERRGKVCVTTKPGGIPAISALWQEHAQALSAETGVELTVLEIDNAVYQLIANPRTFDVIVSPNMFGDVLADAGAMLLGSRGMSYSGNFGANGKAVYQTAHGAAHDLAGTDRANPLGQILSVAMMLRESLDLPEASDLLCRAVESVLERGFRTADIASPACTVIGTKEMSRLVLETVQAEG